jgi:hypothetical protein
MPFFHPVITFAKNQVRDEQQNRNNPGFTCCRHSCPDGHCHSFGNNPNNQKSGVRMYTVVVYSLVGFCAALLGAAGMALVAGVLFSLAKDRAERQAVADQLTQAKAEREALYRQIDELKAAGPKRHTYSTTAGLEDALAIAIDVITEYDASRKYTEARISQLRDALAKVREGPHAYDPDKPAGKRSNGR